MSDTEPRSSDTCNDRCVQSSCCPLSSGRTAAWTLLIILLFLGAVAVAGVRQRARAVVGDAPGEGPIQWQSDLARGLEASQTAGKLVLVDFAAQWCTPCRIMDAEIFRDPGIAAAIEQDFVPVRIDMTNPDRSQRALADRYQVRG